MRPEKRIPAYFFRTASGGEPVRFWLKSTEVSRDDRRRIGEAIKRVEYGWPLGMPICRSLGQALWEIRVSLADRIARLIFCVYGNRMILLHGFIKKTQRTSKSDIALALRRKRTLELGA